MKNPSFAYHLANIQEVETESILKINKINPHLEFVNYSYSQNGEDLSLIRQLSNHPIGYYLDVGAHHPFRFSNTALLNSKGWIGTNIEPNPSSIALFNDARPNDVNICIGLGDSNSFETYYEYKEQALNTISKERMEKLLNLGISPTSLSKIQVFESKSVLEGLFSPDTYVFNIDVEGLDFKVIQNLDYANFYPCYILIESLTITNFTNENDFQVPLLRNYITIGLFENTLMLKSKDCKHKLF